MDITNISGNKKMYFDCFCSNLHKSKHEEYEKDP